MFKLVVIKQFGFEIEMFAELANARHKFRHLVEQSRKRNPGTVAIFMYDDKDELIGATNVAVL